MSALDTNKERKCLILFSVLERIPYIRLILLQKLSKFCMILYLGLIDTKNKKLRKNVEKILSRIVPLGSQYCIIYSTRSYFFLKNGFWIFFNKYNLTFTYENYIVKDCSHSVYRQLSFFISNPYSSNEQLCKISTSLQTKIVIGHLYCTFFKILKYWPLQGRGIFLCFRT